MKPEIEETRTGGEPALHLQALGQAGTGPFMQQKNSRSPARSRMSPDCHNPCFHSLHTDSPTPSLQKSQPASNTCLVDARPRTQQSIVIWACCMVLSHRPLKTWGKPWTLHPPNRKGGLPAGSQGEGRGGQGEVGEGWALGPKTECQSPLTNATLSPRTQDSPEGTLKMGVAAMAGLGEQERGLWSGIPDHAQS